MLRVGSCCYKSRFEFSFGLCAVLPYRSSVAGAPVMPDHHSAGDLSYLVLTRVRNVATLNGGRLAPLALRHVRRRSVTLVRRHSSCSPALSQSVGQLLVPGATTVNPLQDGAARGELRALLGTDQLGRDVVAISIAGPALDLARPVVIALALCHRHGPRPARRLRGPLVDFGSLGYRPSPVHADDPSCSRRLGIFGASYWWRSCCSRAAVPYDTRIVRAGRSSR